MPEAHWAFRCRDLDDLHSCVSTKRQAVRVHENPMYLGCHSGRRRGSLCGGLEPRLGKANLRTLTIIGSVGDVLRDLIELNRLRLLPVVHAGICTDKTDPPASSSHSPSLVCPNTKVDRSPLKEVMTNKSGALLDSDAQNKAIECRRHPKNSIWLVLAKPVTATVTVWMKTPRGRQKQRVVEKDLQGQEFTYIVEDGQRA